MQSTCHNTWCQQPFTISDADMQFYDRVAPVINGRKLHIPPPTLCPPCRQQRRFACRNDREYYPNVCALCSKQLISSYSQDKPFGVLCDECFWNDRWDPLTYGREFDFTRSFFDQFNDLRQSVPRLAIYHTQSENAQYTVHSSRNRNCYMGSSLVDCEDVHYSDFTFESKDSLDLFSCKRVELCYECIFCEDCFQCDECEDSTNLSDCMLCLDCKGSKHLVGCVGLRNTENKILNTNAPAEQCRATVQKLKTDPMFRLLFIQRFQALQLAHAYPASWQINTEHCTGTHIWNSKDTLKSFNVRDMEDVRHIYEASKHVTTGDVTRTANGEMLYECANNVDLTFSCFCNLCYQCHYLLYCDNCNGTEHCFSCIGMKKHKYCILNKQYSKEEYEALVPKIVEHMKKVAYPHPNPPPKGEGVPPPSGRGLGGGSDWGEFFPIWSSPFGYNETKASEWYPVLKDDALDRQWQWSTYEFSPPNVQRTIPAKQLPSNIANIPDDVLNWAVVCEKTGKPFRIIAQELSFYRQRNLPIPHLCPNERHLERVRSRCQYTMYNRTCYSCKKDIQTTYSPDKPEKVYCEECYLKEVY